MELKFIKSQENKIIKRYDTCVILHMYYPEMWKDLLPYLLNLDKQFDLFVTIPYGVDISEEMIQEEFPNAQIYRCENRGRDVAPFLVVFSAIAKLGYKYVCKVHTKKSPHIAIGIEWQQDMLQKLLGSREMISRIKKAFDAHPDWGLIAPQGHVAPYNYSWVPNSANVIMLASSAGIPTDHLEFKYVAGTMFWFRPEAFYILLETDILRRDFEDEQGKLDGTLAHAYERFFGMVISHAGYKIAESDMDKVRLTNIPFQFRLLIQSSRDQEENLNSQLLRKEKQIQTLSEQVVELEQQVQILTEKEAEKEQQVKAIRGQLREITTSKAWRLAIWLRRTWVLLLPPGSFRTRLARKIVSVLLSPFFIRRTIKAGRDSKLVRNSGLFDSESYLANNPDVRQANINPLMHFMYNGWKEGRNPSPLFDVKFYLENNPDVSATGINPVLHYIKFGKTEGRLPKADEGIGKIQSFSQVNSADKNSIDGYQTANGFPAGNNPYSINGVKTILWKTHNYYLKRGLLATISKSMGRIYSSIITPTINKKNKDILHYYEILYAARSNTDEYVYELNNYPKLCEVDTKLIAFYLPQYHPIPENDEWWGKGFTEWTNVSKAIPNFKGHYQPRLPGELGFYDLRIPEVQKRQIELARNYGIYGFCIHYYWFNRKRLLERPLNQFLENPDLDFPFCLCWANENWTRRWDGAENQVLIAQTHTEDEHLAFIRDIIPHFSDDRYIRVNGKPMLIVYRVDILTNPKLAVDIWRSECKKMGIGDIYLVAAQTFGITDPQPYGFDAAVEFPPHNLGYTQVEKTKIQITNPYYKGIIFDYSKAVQLMKKMAVPDYTLFRTVMPGWDNTARKQNDGFTWLNSSPSAYQAWLEYTISYTKRFLPKDKQFVFINSWNEWGEGAYLEPDRLYGYAYLKATLDAIMAYS